MPDSMTSIGQPTPDLSPLLKNGGYFLIGFRNEKLWIRWEHNANGGLQFSTWEGKCYFMDLIFSAENFIKFWFEYCNMH